MPYTGMDPKLIPKMDNCVKDLMAKGKEKSSAIAICRTSLENAEIMIKEKVPFKFSTNFTVISESTKDRVYKKVRGVALKASTSRNNVTYTLEEMDKAKNSLIGRNLKVNHSEDVTNNVGRITSAYLNGDSLFYEAEIFNTAKYPDIVEMVQNGLIQHVSIEAIAKEVIQEGDLMKATGIEFTGLGLVDTPGIPEASVAMYESFKSIESPKEVPISKEIIKEEIMVQEKEIKPTDGKCPEGYEMHDGICKMMAEPMMQSIQPQIQEKVETKLENVENVELKEKIKSLEEEMKKIKETPIPKGKIAVAEKKGLSLIRERTGKEYSFYSEDVLY